MKTTAATLVLLAIAATTAMAQVPRTMNYQGRIVDGAAPVNGTRTMTLRLYTTATGGSAIFSETQSVEFKEGMFTVGIGNGTPGGIPASVAFDRQYWMGVTISDFNNNEELAPRFILRSSPYSLRTAIADSAVIADSAAIADSARSSVSAAHADRAGTLDLPATLEATDADAATLSVANGGGTGLRTQGASYAIVSEGVDSTARYYVAGESAGAKAVPVTGAFYRDNAPVAWAVVQSDGTILSDFGVTSVSKISDQGYEVVLDNPARLITFGSLQVPEFTPVIVPGGSVPPNTDPLRLFTNWNFKRESGGTLNPQTIIVRFVDTQGVTTAAPFSIVVFGRPQ